MFAYLTRNLPSLLSCILSTFTVILLLFLRLSDSPQPSRFWYSVVSLDFSKMRPYRLLASQPLLEAARKRKREEEQKLQDGNTQYDALREEISNVEDDLFEDEDLNTHIEPSTEIVEEPLV